MSFSLNRKTVLVALATFGFLVLAAFNLHARLVQEPYADDGVVWVTTKRGVQAQFVRPESPSDRAGVLRGDIIRALDFDGSPIEITSDWQIQYFLDEKIGIGGNVTYIVEQFNPLGVSKGLWAAELQGVTPQPNRFPLDAYLCLVGLIYLFIGLYVYFKQDQTPQTLHFHAVCLLSFAYLFLGRTGEGDALDKIVGWTDKAALILLCPMFLHFCAMFPRPSRRLAANRWGIALFYVPALVLAALETAHATLGKHNLDLLEIRPWLNRAEILHFTAYFIAGAGVLVTTFSQTKAAVLRQQIKWIVWGMSLGILPWTIFYGYPYVAGFEPSPLMEALAVGPTILIPLSFGYSIVRYRLMDVDMIVRRGMTYALATLSVIVLFMLGVVKFAEWATDLLPTISGSAVTFLQVAVMSLGAVAYNPIKNWLQERIDRLFYGDQYDYRRGVAEFGRTLAATTDLTRLSNAVSARLSEMLTVDEIAVFVRASSGGKEWFAPVPTKGRPAHRMPEDVQSVLLAHPQSRPGIPVPNTLASKGFLTSEFFSPTELDTGDLSLAPSLYYFFPCVVRDRTAAVIGLGKTQFRTLLTSEDTDLLRGLVPYVAVAIENSLLYQTEQDRIRELAGLKEFNENIIESINVGLSAVDPEGRVTNWNGVLEDLLGIPKHEAQGRLLRELLDPDLIRTMHDLTGSLSWALHDVRQIYRYKTASRDGRTLVLNISLSPLETKDEGVAGALISFEDITDRVRLEEQIREHDKLSSIGLLAAGVAHEVNTPLTGISSYTQMLLQQIPETDPKHSVLKKVQRQTVRASEIVNNLLNFSRTGNARFAELDIRKLLDDTLQLLEHQLRNTRIQVVREYPGDLHPVSGHAGKLQQVFMNLILNARDAMPNGGTLKITALNFDNSLLVELSDTGEGILPEHITKIYDPFFTTKEVGAGTGLGLAVSYGIIQEHSGRIFVESEPGKGTCFRIKLPSAVAAERLQAVGD